LAVVAAAFVLCTVAVSLLLMLVTWDQTLIDFFAVAAGLAVIGFVFFKTRSITAPRPPAVDEADALSE
jgi:hypothetical protein